MKNKRLVFDQLESRTALCAAMGGLIAGIAQGSIPFEPIPGVQPDSANPSQVGTFKSGYASTTPGGASTAIHFHDQPGQVCNPTPDP